jgi:WD40 repeat protein
MREFQVAKVGEITHLSFSPDGRLLAVCSERSNTRLWDVASGKVARVLPGTPGSLEAHFTSGGAILTRSHQDVLLWPADSRGSRVVASSRGYSVSIELAVSPDAARFVRFEPWHPESELSCRGLPSGDLLWRVKWARESRPTLLFSPDGRHVAAVVGRQVELRDASTGEVVRKWGQYDSWGPSHPPAAFRPDGLALACRWFAGVDVLHPETGDVLTSISPGNSSGCPVAFTPDGRLFATAVVPDNDDSDEEDDDSAPEEESCDLHFWDARTWAQRGAFRPGIGIVCALVFSPDGMTAAVAGDGGKVVILDLVDLDAELLGCRGV